MSSTSVRIGVYTGINTQSCPALINSFATALSFMHEPQNIPAAPAVK
jgi:hypothetical protein